jgi:hypothetical protein
MLSTLKHLDMELSVPIIMMMMMTTMVLAIFIVSILGSTHLSMGFSVPIIMMILGIFLLLIIMSILDTYPAVDFYHLFIIMTLTTPVNIIFLFVQMQNGLLLLRPLRKEKITPRIYTCLFDTSLCLRFQLGLPPPASV